MSFLNMPDRVKALILAAIAEGFCLMAGVAAFVMTDKLIWIFIGVVAGMGFILPALIVYLKASKERNHASG